MGICALCYIFMKRLCGVMVFQRSILNWRRGWGQSAMDICTLSICHGYMCIVLYIYETYLVQLFSRDLYSIGGGDGVNLPWGYVYHAIYIYIYIYIYETYLV